MKNEEIKILLEKFYNGETSLDEEKLLKKYFSETDNISEEFATDKVLFNTINFETNTVEMPENLSDKISAAIDEKNKQEQAPIVLNSRQMHHRKIAWWSVAAAACVACIVAISAIIYNAGKSEPAFLANVPMTEQQAYARANQALTKISKNISKSLQPLNKTNLRIEKSLSPIVKTNSKVNAINSKVEKVLSNKF